MIEGILGRKLGMSQVFAEDGTVVPITAIEAGPCVVTQVRQAARDGYTAAQLGFGQAKAKHLSAAERGHLGHQGLNRARRTQRPQKERQPLGLFRHLREFSVDDPSAIEVGQTVDVSIFSPGDQVDVAGISKGRGFAGGVKRYHFAGGPKTHGQSDRHRAPGSIGATTTPGRVYKGHRMAGHLGAKRITVQNLTVVRTEPEANLLLIKGAVPGARGGLLIICKAVKS